MNNQKEKMPDFPDEIINLEKLEINNNNLKQISWKITLQVVEHFFNSISKIDKHTNKHLPRLLSDILEEAFKEQNKNISVPLSNDYLFQIVDFSFNALKHIFINPKQKIIREYEMTPIHKVRNMNTKSLNWISKLPGRTIREKLSNKNKILSSKSKFSFDTKENRVLVRFILELSKFVNARLNYGVENNIYQFNEDSEIYNKLLSFHKFSNKKFKHSELSEVKPALQPEPNNVLINEQSYSVVWRSWQKLLNYEYVCKTNWKKAKQRYIQTIYWSIIANLSMNKYFNFENNLAIISENFGKDIGIKTYNNNQLSFSEDYSFIVDKPNELLNGIIKTIINEDSRKFGFISQNKEDYYFDPRTIKDLEKFNNLQKGQKVYFKIKKDNDKVIVNNIRYSFALGLYQIKISRNEDNIDFNIQQLTLKNKIFEAISSKAISYKINFDSNVKYCRGISFHIEKTIDDKILNSYQFSNYADFKGLRSIALIISQELFSVLDLNSNIKTINTSNSVKIENVGFDFSTYLPKISHQQISFAKDFYSLIYSFENSDQIWQAKKYHIYNLKNQCLHLNYLLSLNVQQKNSQIIFNQIVRNLSEEITIKEGHYFSYTIPDIIDEFAQQKIKSVFRANLKKSFPVWRSIASTLYIQSKKKSLELKENDIILVIDTHSIFISSTILKTKRNKDLNNFIFEHYPPLPYCEEDNELSFLKLQLEYAKNYLEKYNLNADNDFLMNLVSSGMVEKVILNNEKFILTINNEDKFILDLDEKIWGKIKEQWYSNFENYMSKFSNNAVYRKSIKPKKGNHLITILLSDFIKEYDKIFLEKLRKSTYSNQTYIIKNLEIAKGSSVISERLQNELPTWLEWLPDLSLEVIKDGHFSEIELVKGSSVEQSLGTEKIFKIEEILTIPAKVNKIKFPLISGLTNGNPINFEAEIKDDSFPLKENVDVRLQIKYRYGFENSYELSLFPTDKDNSSFKQIIAEWIDENVVKEDVENVYPEFPEKKKVDSSIIHNVIIDIKELFEKLDRIFDNEFKFGNRNNYPIDKNTFEYIASQLKRNRKKLTIVCDNFKENEETQFFLKDFFESDFLKLIAKVLGFSITNLEKYNLVEEYYQVAEFAELKKECKNFICCLGYLTPSSIKQQLFQNFDNDKKTNIMSLGRTIRNAVFSSYKDILDIYSKTYVASYRNNDLRTLETIESALTLNMWNNEDMVKNIFEKYPIFINTFLRVIEKRFKALLSDILKYINHQKPEKWYIYPSQFRDSSELLLAILRIRKYKNNYNIEVGSKRMINVAKYVRKIDYLLFKLNWQVRVRVHFDVNKPESLKNMSNLAFVLNAYLTGETGKSRIRIVGVDEDA